MLVFSAHSGQSYDVTVDAATHEEWLAVLCQQCMVDVEPRPVVLCFARASLHLDVIPNRVIDASNWLDVGDDAIMIYSARSLLGADVEQVEIEVLQIPQQTNLPALLPSIHATTQRHYEQCVLEHGAFEVHVLALRLAIGSLDVYCLKTIKEHQTWFASITETLDVQKELVNSTEKDLERCAAITIHPRLATAQGRTLASYISRERMLGVRLKCLELLKNHQAHVSEVQGLLDDLQSDVNVLKGVVMEVFGGAILANDAIEEAHQAVERVREISRAVQESGVADSEELVGELMELDGFVREDLMTLHNLRNSTLKQYMTHIKHTSTLSSRLAMVPELHASLLQAISLQIPPFSHLHRLHSLAPSYIVCVAEMYRRENWTRWFVQNTGALQEALAQMVSAEAEKRDKMQISFKELPWTLKGSDEVQVGAEINLEHYEPMGPDLIQRHDVLALFEYFQEHETDARLLAERVLSDADMQIEWNRLLAEENRTRNVTSPSGLDVLTFSGSVKGETEKDDGRLELLKQIKDLQEEKNLLQEQLIQGQKDIHDHKAALLAVQLEMTALKPTEAATDSGLDIQLPKLAATLLSTCHTVLHIMDSQAPGSPADQRDLLTELQTFDHSAFIKETAKIMSRLRAVDGEIKSWQDQAQARVAVKNISMNDTVVFLPVLQSGSSRIWKALSTDRSQYILVSPAEEYVALWRIERITQLDECVTGSLAERSIFETNLGLAKESTYHLVNGSFIPLTPPAPRLNEPATMANLVRSPPSEYTKLRAATPSGIARAFSKSPAHVNIARSNSTRGISRHMGTPLMANPQPIRPSTLLHTDSSTTHNHSDFQSIHNDLNEHACTTSSNSVPPFAYLSRQDSDSKSSKAVATLALQIKNAQPTSQLGTSMTEEGLWTNTPDIRPASGLPTFSVPQASAYEALSQSPAAIAVRHNSVSSSSPHQMSSTNQSVPRTISSSLSKMMGR